ncbi:MAG: PHB depolymerase family esterase [Bacteroidetes bacterium]|nr:PHB depolymerase family esterase [Bacteroidota bacterium]
MNKKNILLLLLTFFFFHISFSQDLKRVRHFGKNKGHLKMYLHTPPNADKSKPAPMVVVLHGCLQCATKVQKQSGWSKLADENGFYVLYPQQRFFNNPEKCFRWYKRKHTNKGRGENASIKKMVEYMQANYAIDSSKIFITGLSAGAAMSVVMMADYPETFNSGAVFAGGAYKAGNGYVSAAMAFLGWRVKPAEKWANIVRKQNPNYKGEYPRMIIYQGNSDWIVNKRNGVEIMKQWTSLHHISTTPTETIDGYLNVKDIHRLAYNSPTKKEAVVFYKVDKLSHALLVDPGKCKNQGGRRGFFSKDKNYNSTLWTAYDFGLLKAPEIDGPHEALLKQTVTYSVPLTNGCTYEWTFPEGCTLVTDQNTNSITLNWGASSGCINVTEMDANGCKKQFKTVFVTVRDFK